MDEEELPFRQSITPTSVMLAHGWRVGTGGFKCPCCGCPMLRASSRRRLKRGRIKTQKKPQKLFWFEQKDPA